MKALRAVQAGVIPEVQRPKARKEKYQERVAIRKVLLNPPKEIEDYMSGFDYHCEGFPRPLNKAEQKLLGLELTDEW